MTSASTKRRHGRKVDERALADLAERIRNAPPSTNGYAQRDAEIQRLRAAMVHAMDDCERVATLPDARSDVRRWASAAARTLKSALEKK